MGEGIDADDILSSINSEKKGPILDVTSSSEEDERIEIYIE